MNVTINVNCKCETVNCEKENEMLSIEPSQFFVSGVPICEVCGEDLVYVSTTVNMEVN